MFLIITPLRRRKSEKMKILGIDDNEDLLQLCNVALSVEVIYDELTSSILSRRASMSTGFRKIE